MSIIVQQGAAPKAGAGSLKQGKVGDSATIGSGATGGDFGGGSGGSGSGGSGGSDASGAGSNIATSDRVRLAKARTAGKLSGVSPKSLYSRPQAAVPSWFDRKK